MRYTVTVYKPDRRRLGGKRFVSITEYTDSERSFDERQNLRRAGYIVDVRETDPK